MAGRGFGKTRVGAEAVCDFGVANPRTRIAVVAPTAGDVRGVCFEGDSGILACLPAECSKDYIRGYSELTLPNGTFIKGFSAEEPERLRGPQFHFAWCDELAAWRKRTKGETAMPEGYTAWDMLMFALRLGDDPRAVVTSTPKPVLVLREILADPNTVVTKGSTYDNRKNLPAKFFRKLIRKYEGTRLGRQELNAELLDDIPGALWERLSIEKARIQPGKVPDMERVVVAIDPAVTATQESDETGIVVAGRGVDGQGYVFDDLTCRLSPDGWARRAIAGYHKRAADRIIGEVNNGGDMVAATVRTVDPNVAFKEVRASRGKIVRAEPVAALYEQGRIHHVGTFDQLEDQMCMFTADNIAGNSPDRVDALVWALTELFLEEDARGILDWYEKQAEAVKRRKSE